jgi:predicted  nucleic acid-binding Zn-ribbon protein
VFAEQRSKIESRVPREPLALYDRIRRRKPQAMVEVIDGTCQGCHLQIPPQIYNEAQRGERVLQCPNCTRIIYWRKPDRDRPPAADGKSP